MLTLKNSDHIITNRNIVHIHSCRTNTGISLKHVDMQRLWRSDMALLNSRIKRTWLNEQWLKHQKCCEECYERPA